MRIQGRLLTKQSTDSFFMSVLQTLIRHKHVRWTSVIVHLRQILTLRRVLKDLSTVAVVAENVFNIKIFRVAKKNIWASVKNAAIPLILVRFLVNYFPLKGYTTIEIQLLNYLIPKSLSLNRCLCWWIIFAIFSGRFDQFNSEIFGDFM